MAEELQEFNVDEALNRLEEINKKLTSPDIKLNDALNLYKEGVELVSKCETSLKGVESQIKDITKEE